MKSTAAPKVSTQSGSVSKSESIFADVGACEPAAYSQVRRREIHLIDTTEDLRRTGVDLPRFFGEHTENVLNAPRIVRNWPAGVMARLIPAIDALLADLSQERRGCQR
jgi:hypothetical protein